MKDLYYKLHEGKYGMLLAVCDKDVCGKTLKDMKTHLEFFVNPRFYRDQVGDGKKVKELLSQSVDANLVGKKAVQIGLDLGLIEKENIIKIAGVPHAIFSIMLE